MAEECTKAADIAVINEKVTSLCKEVENLKKVYDALQTISLSIVELTSELKNMKATIGDVKEGMKDLKSDVEEIKERPAKAFFTYKQQIIGAIMVAIVGYLMGKLL